MYRFLILSLTQIPEVLKFYHICYIIVSVLVFLIFENKFIGMMYLCHQELQCVFLENKDIYHNQKINFLSRKRNAFLTP